MKLLFTQDALASGGAERSHLEILSRFFTTIEVLFVYFYPKHELLAEYQKAGFRLIFLDIPEPYHFPTAISRLVKLIRKEKPDLLVSSLWRADQITRIASLLTHVPLVGTLVNDSYAPMAWQDKQGFKHKIVHLLDRATARIPVHWIANAQALSTSHVKNLGLRPSEISVVYRGRSIPEKIWDKTRIENNVEPFSFVSYGRLLERKGFQDAIQAFALSLQDYPNCILTIYGEGSFRPQLEFLIQKLNLQSQVKLPGKVSNPTALLTAADCFLFPSWYEGFSGALVEAMMAGIPIIASDIPMNLEAVTSGESALIFPVRSIHGLSNQMMDAMKHPDEMAEMGKRAAQKAANLFSIERIAALYEEKLIQIHRQNLR